MKKLLIILTFFFFPSFVHAAIHASTVWEFRADGTAGNVNGGGFNSANATPGTDYSQLPLLSLAYAGC